MINGILFRLRTGIPWRDLPSRFGKWQTAYDRHRRWSADGTWEKILRTVQADADAQGRIDWSMASVTRQSARPTSTPRAPATNPRKYRACEPGLLATGTTKGSAAPAAGLPQRSTRSVKAACAPWPS